jgi:hypothetical protein
VTNEALGAACTFEATTRPFRTWASPLPCLSRGRRAAGTNREANQEDFLVLAGECLLLIEGEERSLKAWDFVHCPPNTEHGFVGAGVDAETTAPAEAYAPFPTWRLGPPEDWNALPWVQQRASGGRIAHKPLPMSIWALVFQGDNLVGVYQGSTRLSSQVTASHRQSRRLGATKGLT